MTHNYTTPANYTVLVNASSCISNVTDTIYVAVQIPIVNMLLTHETYLAMIGSSQSSVNTEFTLKNDPNFPAATGVFYRTNIVNPDSNVFGSAVAVPTLGDPNQVVNISQTFNDADVGSHLGKVQIYNLVSQLNITLPEPLVVVKEVSGASVLLHSTEGKEVLKVNETNQFTGLVATGSDVQYKMNYGDNNEGMEPYGGNAANVQIHFNHSYSNAGNYTVCLNASNSLSWNQSCMTQEVIVQFEAKPETLELQPVTTPIQLNGHTAVNFRLRSSGPNHPTDPWVKLRLNPTKTWSEPEYRAELMMSGETILTITANPDQDVGNHTAIACVFSAVTNPCVSVAASSEVDLLERLGIAKMVVMESGRTHPYAFKTGENVTFKMNITKGSDLDFKIIDYGEPGNSDVDGPIYHDGQASASDVYEFKHVYAQPGTYNVTGVVENVLNSSVTATLEQEIIVQHKVTIYLTLVPVQNLVQLMENTTIQFTLTSTGNNNPTEPMVKVKLNTDGASYGSDVLHPNLMNAGSAVVTATAASSNVGNHTALACVSNLVTDTCVEVMSSPVNLLEALGVVTLFVDGSQIVQQTNTIVNFKMNITSGSDLRFLITDYGMPGNTDTDVPISHSGSATESDVKTFSHNYTQPGNFTVVGKVENDLNISVTASVEITVRNPIIKTNLQLHHPYVVELPSGAITFGLTVAPGQSEPSDAGIEILHRNFLVYTGRVYSWPYSADLTFSYVCEGNSSIEVRLNNEVSLATFNSVVILMERIATDLMISGEVNWLKNSAATFTITEINGTHWECDVNWGDSSALTTINNSMCTDSVNIQHTYNQTGAFSITATCSNLLNSESTQMSINIKSEVAVSLSSNNTISKPPGTIELIFTAISPMAPMTSSENITFNITYTNPDAINGPKTFNTVQTINFLTTDTISQNVLDRGSYHVMVLVSSEGVNVVFTASTDVTVYETLTGFSISTPRSFAQKNAPVTFKMSLTSGSDYNATITFEPGQQKTQNGRYSTDTLQTSYTFTTPGIYNVTSTCTNPVSSLETSTTITIQSALDLASDVNNAVAQQDGQINITIRSNWVMAVGENVTFTVTFNSPSAFSPSQIAADLVMYQNIQTYTFTISSIGNYVVTVNVSNEIDTWSDVKHFTVQEKIESINFTFWSPENYTDTVGGNEVVRHLAGSPVYFNEIRTTGTAITQCTWNFGDDNTVQTTTGSIGHNYTDGGIFNVIYSCTNTIGTESLTRTVYVGSPLGLESYTVPPKAYLDDGIIIDVTFRELKNVCMSFKLTPQDRGSAVRFWRTVIADICPCTAETVNPSQLQVVTAQLAYK